MNKIEQQTSPNHDSEYDTASDEDDHLHRDDDEEDDDEDLEELDEEEEDESDLDDGSIVLDLERQSGDGQEQEVENKKVDDDEDRSNPQYIPKRGTFYEHDDRTADDPNSDGQKVQTGEVSVTGTGTGEKRTGITSGTGTGIIRTDSEQNSSSTTPTQQTNNKTTKKFQSASAVDRWSHDRFDEGEQAPKSRSELVSAYGYDIRNEDGPPRARRRRRYGRGPSKYTRNWEDETAYAKQGGTPQRNPRPEDFPALGINKKLIKRRSIQKNSNQNIDHNSDSEFNNKYCDENINNSSGGGNGGSGDNKKIQQKTITSNNYQSQQRQDQSNEGKAQYIQQVTGRRGSGRISNRNDKDRNQRLNAAYHRSGPGRNTIEFKNQNRNKINERSLSPIVNQTVTTLPVQATNQLNNKQNIHVNVANNAMTKTSIGTPSVSATSLAKQGNASPVYQRKLNTEMHQTTNEQAQQQPQGNYQNTKLNNNNERYSNGQLESGQGDVGKFNQQQMQQSHMHRNSRERDNRPSNLSGRTGPMQQQQPQPRMQQVISSSVQSHQNVGQIHQQQQQQQQHNNNQQVQQSISSVANESNQRPKRYSSLRQRSGMDQQQAQQNVGGLHEQHDSSTLIAQLQQQQEKLKMAQLQQQQLQQQQQKQNYQPQPLPMHLQNDIKQQQQAGVTSSQQYQQQTGFYAQGAVVPEYVAPSTVVPQVQTVQQQTSQQPSLPNPQLLAGPPQYPPQFNQTPPPQYLQGPPPGTYLAGQPAPQPAQPQIINYVPAMAPPTQQNQYQSYPSYQNYTPVPPPGPPAPPANIYQPQGITYYAPHTQPPPRQILPQRRTNAIPILAPPDLRGGKGRGRLANNQYEEYEESNVNKADAVPIGSADNIDHILDNMFVQRPPYQPPSRKSPSPSSSVANANSEIASPCTVSNTSELNDAMSITTSQASDVEQNIETSNISQPLSESKKIDVDEKLETLIEEVSDGVTSKERTEKDDVIICDAVTNLSIEDKENTIALPSQNACDVPTEYEISSINKHLPNVAADCTAANTIEKNENSRTLNDESQIETISDATTTSTTKANPTDT